jgi:hypothetical protein
MNQEILIAPNQLEDTAQRSIDEQLLDQPQAEQSGFMYQRADGTVEYASDEKEAILRCPVLADMAEKNPEQVNVLLNLASLGMQALKTEVAKPPAETKAKAKVDARQTDEAVKPKPQTAAVHEQTPLAETELPLAKAATAEVTPARAKQASAILNNRTAEQPAATELQISDVGPELQPADRAEPAASRRVEQIIGLAAEAVASQTEKVVAPAKPRLENAAPDSHQKAEVAVAEPESSVEVAQTQPKKATIAERPVAAEVKPPPKPVKKIPVMSKQASKTTRRKAPGVAFKPAPREVKDNLTSSTEDADQIDLTHREVTSEINILESLPEVLPAESLEQPEFGLPLPDQFEDEILEVLAELANEQPFSAEVIDIYQSLVSLPAAEDQILMPTASEIAPEIATQLPEINLATTTEFAGLVEQKLSEQNEQPVTIQEIIEEAASLPLSEVILQLASNLESMPPAPEKTQLFEILAEIEAALPASLATPGEALVLTPELTEKLIAVVRFLGYEKPGEELVEFAQVHGLAALLQALDLLYQQRANDDLKEFISVASRPISGGPNDKKVRLNKLLFGLVVNFA